MRVLVDTSVWSLSLRRNAPKGVEAAELTELIRDGRVMIIGPIRQEILSGIRDSGQFEKLKKNLQAFDDAMLTREDFERAAEIFNLCRSRGIQGSNTDFLICAVAERAGAAIFTTDKDFTGYSRVVKLNLHVPRID